MAHLTSILFALTAATLTSLSNAALWLAAVPPPPCVPPAAAVAFLHARCATTLYGVTCYESLIPYTCTFQTNHVKLARATTEANLAWLRGFSKHVKEVAARGNGASGVGAAVLRDCASTASFAAGLAKQSAAELAKLDASGGVAVGRNKVRWSISKAQTWLSASMMNEATCTDGIGEAGAAMHVAGSEGGGYRSCECEGPHEHCPCVRQRHTDTILM